MGEIRPVGAGKRKGLLLSSMSVPSRISAPISTLPRSRESFWLMPMRSAKLCLRHLRAAHLPDAETYRSITVGS